MKKLMVFVLAGLIASAAHAGDQSVVVTMIGDVPTYFTKTLTVSSGVPESASAGVLAAAPTSRSVSGRTDFRLDNQDALYAQLLKEAQKRGLR